MFYFSVGGRKFQHCATGNLFFFFCSCPISIQGWLFHFIFKYVFFCEREVRVSIIFCAFPFGWWNFSTAENIESNIYQHTHTVLTHSYGKEKVIEPGQGLLAFGPKTKSKPEKLTKQKSFYREFFFPFYYSSNWTNQFHIRFNDPVEMKLTLFNYLLHHFSKW